jgi:RNA polymerase sigma-70 factor, ECF subfamily
VTESPVGSESPATGRLTTGAVAALFAEHGADLLAYLTGVLRNHDLAAEALQNTFRRVLEVGHTARPESIRGWLFRVGFHEGLAMKRRTGAEHRILARYVEQVQVRQPLGEAAPQEQRLLHDEDLARLRSGLEQLSHEQHWVVTRRLYHEETFAVIAANLNVPLGTVLTRMRLATEKLARWMQDSPSEEST